MDLIRLFIKSDTAVKIGYKVYVIVSRICFYSQISKAVALFCGMCPTKS